MALRFKKGNYYRLKKKAIPCDANLTYAESFHCLEWKKCLKETKAVNGQCGRIQSLVVGLGSEVVDLEAYPCNYDELDTKAVLQKIINEIP